MDDAGGIDRNEGRAPAVPGQRLERVQHGFMFDGARHEMFAAARLEGVGRAADREVVGLGAAARVDDLRRVGMNQRGDRRSGIVQEGLGALAEVMDARRVAELVAGGGHDRIEHFRGERGRRVVVKIDTHGELFIVSFALTLGNRRTRQHWRGSIYWHDSFMCGVDSHGAGANECVFRFRRGRYLALAFLGKSLSAWEAF